MTDSKFTDFGSGQAVKVNASIRVRIHMLGESGVEYMMNVFELLHIQSSLSSFVKKTFMDWANSRSLFRVPYSSFLPFSH
ncbi:hypothetical protein BOTCAL_0122g00030 [Botryotinia calthae]|uniref:Uncharacterized protein n=1 Tax=Botryotinia calthae TaxID=38488 RepID=A0A4Y8D4E8_9HELO|nr:hypothetical protein BOTCAL_0122g00030 [Botryotinia calthae]